MNTDRVKYPRTCHVPFSPGKSEDDLLLSDLSAFEGEIVVVTEKMDGENTTLYRTGLHARSIDSGNAGHPSRNWVKQFHAKIAMNIPDNWRICGENLFAKHSIYYPDLASYFYGFSVWNDQNRCLSWPETTEWFDLLGIVSVPVLYHGPFDIKIMKTLHSPVRNGRESEGWVLRKEGSFDYENFSESVAKFVRREHVMTNDHWTHSKIEPNKLSNMYN